MKVFIFLIFFLFNSCSHFHKNSLINAKKFQTSKLSAWQALVKVLEKYPIDFSSEDKGIIITKFIKTNAIFKTPFKRQYEKEGMRYQLTVKMTYNESNAQITIKKQIKYKKDFLSDESTVPSDLFEEDTLLYRIEREIFVHDHIKP